MRRLLAFLDPLLGRAPLIIEAHYRPAGQAQVRDDKAHSRKQLALMVLDLGDDPSRLRPAPRLVREALVAHQWLAAGPSRGPEQDLGNLPLQALVGWNADRIKHAALLPRFLDLRVGKGRVRPESNFLALRLLTLSSVSNQCKVEVSAAPRSQILCELINRNVGSAATRSASLRSS